jgi:hypothetical protein
MNSLSNPENKICGIAITPTRSPIRRHGAAEVGSPNKIAIAPISISSKPLWGIPCDHMENIDTNVDGFIIFPRLGHEAVFLVFVGAAVEP